MKTVYRIKTENQLKHFYSLSLLAIILIGLSIATLFDVFESQYMVWLSVICGVQIILQILLHINYYTVNKNVSFSFDDVNLRYFYSDENNQIVFSELDIEKAIHHKSFPVHNDGFEFLFWDHYNHISIFLKNGSRITVTSLLVTGIIRLPIEESKQKIDLNIYRWALKSKIITSR
jgi:hypothetical protein